MYCCFQIVFLITLESSWNRPWGFFMYVHVCICIYICIYTSMQACMNINVHYYYSDVFCVCYSYFTLQFIWHLSCPPLLLGPRMQGWGGGFCILVKGVSLSFCHQGNSLQYISIHQRLSPQLHDTKYIQQSKLLWLGSTPTGKHYQLGMHCYHGLHNKIEPKFRTPSWLRLWVALSGIFSLYLWHYHLYLHIISCADKYKFFSSTTISSSLCPSSVYPYSKVRRLSSIITYLLNISLRW